MAISFQVKTQRYKQRWKDRRHAQRNRAAIKSMLSHSSNIYFDAEIKRLLGVQSEWLNKTAEEYNDCPSAWQHLSSLKSPSRETDGWAKSIDVAEGFAAWALIKRFRPRVLVELGVNKAISSRLWKDALNRYVPGHKLYLCDLDDHRVAINDDEAIFVRGDAFETLKNIFAQEDVGLLFNDAHPYRLIDWSVRQGITH